MKDDDTKNNAFIKNKKIKFESLDNTYDRKDKIDKII